MTRVAAWPDTIEAERVLTVDGVDTADTPII